MSRALESGPETVHATAICFDDRSALIRGPSGSGKSDLALRCLTTSLPTALAPLRAELVSDDQVTLTRTSLGIRTAPPAAIAGKMEVRGLGILEFPHRPSARLVLIVDLVSAGEVPRYPLDRTTATCLGLDIPVIRLAPFEASAPVKLLLALAEAGEG